MPIHDWTRVDAGLFHAFHQEWTIALCNALNSGLLSADYYALPEQNIRGPIRDVLTLQRTPAGEDGGTGGSTLAVATAPPRARVVPRKDAEIYTHKADRVTVRHRHGDVVAVLEIVSHGNKGSQADCRAFVEKAISLLRQRIHLLIVDLLPPGPRDPQGLHHAIWEAYGGEEVARPADKPLVLAAYDAGEELAYVEFAAVGDPLPELPLFLEPGRYVPAPLEATYQTTWQLFPAALKPLLTAQA